MGTSNPYAGPRPQSPLLPPWAPSGGDDGPFPDDGHAPAGDDVPVPGGTPAVPVLIPGFRAAKARMTRFVQSGGRRGLKAAARSYVAGRGGARGAATAARTGRAAAARLGSFLGTVVSRGATEALREFGLDRLVGQSAERVFAALANMLAPLGETLEDAAARKAVDEALCLLYEKLELDADADLATLDSLTAAMVRESLQACVAGYIYHRWLQEIGEKIAKNAISAGEAVKLERQVKRYVTEAVKLDFRSVNVLKIDWNSSEGRRRIDRIFREAYSFLEA